MITNFNKNFKMDFKGGNLSSDGGAILMLAYLHSKQMLSGFNKLSFNDNRKLPIYSNCQISSNLIANNLLGYFRQSDQFIIRNDPLLSNDENIASQSTVSRLFDRVTFHTNLQLGTMISKMAFSYINEHVEHPVFDADSTLIQTYGNQEGSSYIYHYKEEGYHPLIINEFNSKLIVFSRLRTGSSYSSNYIIEAMKEILPLIKGKDHKTIRFRGDSAFYDSDLMNELNRMNIKYFIRCKGYSSLHHAVEKDLEKRKVDLSITTSDHPVYGEIRYKMTNNKNESRIIYKAYGTEDKNNQMCLLPVIYCVITNQDNGNPKSIMDFYEERGASENFTKELKNDAMFNQIVGEGLNIPN